MSMEMDQLVNTVSGAGSTNAMRSTQPNLSRQGAGAPALAGAIAAPLMPQIDVIQRPDALVVRADLPGLKADEIDVSVEDGMLVISGERREQHEDDQGGVRRSEVVYGTFYRTIPLPDGADEDSVVAAFNNGVLEIIVPVAEREQARRVQVRG
jgi:HSP20 family protein